MTGHKEAQDLSQVVHDRFRRNVLRAMARMDGQLDAGYRELARVLREQFAELAVLSEDEVLDRLLLAFARAEPGRLRIIENAITDAARNGVRVTPEVFRRVFGELVEGSDEVPFDGASGSSATPKLTLRLLPGSGGSPPETD